MLEPLRIDAFSSTAPGSRIRWTYVTIPYVLLAKSKRAAGRRSSIARSDLIAHNASDSRHWLLGQYCLRACEGQLQKGGFTERGGEQARPR
jgi:hypothetical protein